MKQLLPPNCPMTVPQIVELDIDNFNELMGRYNFTEDTIAQYRDIRRKGKNRVRHWSHTGCNELIRTT